MAKPDAAATLVSVLMPVVDGPVHLLNAAIASVLGQHDARWELCICDHGASNDDVLALLDYYRGRDARIKIVRSPRDLPVAGAANLAATLATGRFVGVLDSDGLLAPAALTAVTRVVEADPAADLLCFDADDAEADDTEAEGSVGEPCVTPDRTPEPRPSVMDLRRFLVLRKSLFLRIGGLREAGSGAQDDDLALRAGAAAVRVVHLREGLYRRCKSTGPIASRFPQP